MSQARRVKRNVHKLMRDLHLLRREDDRALRDIREIAEEANTESGRVINTLRALGDQDLKDPEKVAEVEEDLQEEIDCLNGMMFLQNDRSGRLRSMAVLMQQHAEALERLKDGLKTKPRVSLIEEARRITEQFRTDSLQQLGIELKTLEEVKRDLAA